MVPSAPVRLVVLGPGSSTAKARSAPPAGKRCGSITPARAAVQQGTGRVREKRRSSVPCRIPSPSRPSFRVSGPLHHQAGRGRPEARCPARARRYSAGPRRSGGVAERLKAHAWKACIRETVSRVRIPLPPPYVLEIASKFCHTWEKPPARYPRRWSGRKRLARWRPPSVSRSATALMRILMRIRRVGETRNTAHNSERHRPSSGLARRRIGCLAAAAPGEAQWHGGGRCRLLIVRVPPLTPHCFSSAQFWRPDHRPAEPADGHRSSRCRARRADPLSRQARSRSRIEIGRRLTECKKRLGHGQWGTWLDREFRWSDRQALNFMRVYELVESKSENFAELQISVSALYLLAAPSTPPEVRDEIIERAERGEKLTHAKVLERVRLRRPPSPRPAPGAAAPPPDARAQPTPTATDATPPAKPDRRRCGFGDSTSSAVAIAKRLLVDLFAQGMKAEPKQVACALREVVPAGSPMDKLIHWLDCLLAEMRARTSEREILAPTAERSEMAGSTRAIPGKHQ